MKEVDSILKAKVGTHQHFKIDENYFERLKTNIHSKTIDHNQPKTIINLNWALAIIALLVVASSILLINYNNTPTPAYTIAFNTGLNSEALLAELSTEDLIEYISSNNIPLNLVDSASIEINPDENWIEFL